MNHVQELLMWWFSQNFVAYLVFIPFSLIVVVGGLIKLIGGLGK